PRPPWLGRRGAGRRGAGRRPGRGVGAGYNSLTTLRLYRPAFSAHLRMKKCLFLLLSLATQAIAQTPRPAAGAYPPLVTFTAEQDHANMMQQLG
nr:hypothetical protein [Tanacetum cinerariifolium]